MMMKRARTLAGRVAAGTVCGSVLLAPACAPGGSRVGDAPLGWEGATAADEERVWSMESLESVARWKTEEAPLFATVPDSMKETPPFLRALDSLGEAPPGVRQRYPAEGTFLPDGRVVLLYYVSEDLGADSILLHFVDPGSGEETFVPAPKGADDRFLEWVHFDLVTHDGSIILMGDNQPTLSGRRGEDIWVADYDGRFIASPSSTHFEGMLLGVFRDRSLAVLVDAGDTNAMILSSVMAFDPAGSGNHPADGRAGEVLVTTAMPRDPASASIRAPSGLPYPVHTTAVAGDTIWLMPTEKPELYAVDRSGNVVLKVEWEAGDRSIPPGMSDLVEGLERFPAALQLMVGADGLIYVERLVLVDGRPVRDEEWLVFSPAGELVARLDIGGRFPSFSVLAFGDGALVAVAEDEDTGLQRVEVYSFGKPG